MMNWKEILAVFFFLILGIIMLVKPKWMWMLKYGLTVQSGEPTDLYLVSTQIVGALIVVVAGFALIYSLFF